MPKYKATVTHVSYKEHEFTFDVPSDSRVSPDGHALAAADDFDFTGVPTHYATTEVSSLTCIDTEPEVELEYAGGTGELAVWTRSLRAKLAMIQHLKLNQDETFMRATAMDDTPAVFRLPGAFWYCVKGQLSGDWVCPSLDAAQGIVGKLDRPLRLHTTELVQGLPELIVHHGHVVQDLALDAEGGLSYSVYVSCEPDATPEVVRQQALEAMWNWLGESYSTEAGPKPSYRIVAKSWLVVAILRAWQAQQATQLERAALANIIVPGNSVVSHLKEDVPLLDFLTWRKNPRDMHDTSIIACVRRAMSEFRSRS